MSTTGQLLEPFLGMQVAVATLDGKLLVGKLAGYDPQCNVALQQCKERIFSSSGGVDTIEHGLYIVRGDNVAALGDVDDEVDAAVEWDQVVAEPIKPIRH